MGWGVRLCELPGFRVLLAGQRLHDPELLRVGEVGAELLRGLLQDVLLLRALEAGGDDAGLLGELVAERAEAAETDLGAGLHDDSLSCTRVGALNQQICWSRAS